MDVDSRKNEVKGASKKVDLEIEVRREQGYRKRAS